MIIVQGFYFAMITATLCNTRIARMAPCIILHILLKVAVTIGWLLTLSSLNSSIDQVVNALLRFNCVATRFIYWVGVISFGVKVEHRAATNAHSHFVST